MMTNSRKRTAVVTGGSLGFGRAVAGALVADGWHVVIDGRDRETAEEVAAAIGAVAVPGDVTDPAHRRHLLDLPGLDLLVNNASTLGPSPLPRSAAIPSTPSEPCSRPTS